MGFGVLFVRQLSEDEINTVRWVLRNVQDGRLAVRHQVIEAERA